MLKRLIIVVMAIMLIASYSVYADGDKRESEYKEYEDNNYDYDDDHERDDHDEDDENDDDRDEYGDVNSGADNVEVVEEVVVAKQLPRQIAVKLADQQNSLTVKPVYEKGMLLAPAKALMDYINADYIQYDENGILELFAENQHLVFRVNKSVIYIDGIKHSIPSPPVMLNGTYYLPLEQLLNLLNYNLTWLEDQNLLLVKRSGS